MRLAFPSRSAFLTFLLFLVAGIALYAWTLDFPFVRWDDGMLITENPAIRHISWATIKWIFTHFDPELYIPFTFLSYQLNYLVGGVDPFVYKLTNVLLHACNAMLVYSVLSRLLKHRLLALFLGLLFLVHPLNSEAVLWASARKDLLAGFFGLWSMLLFLDHESEGEQWKRSVSVLLFLCALLSKVIAIVLPPIMLLLLLARGERSVRVLVRILWPYVVLAFVFGCIALFGKTDVTALSSTWQKIVVAPASLLFYLPKIFFPLHFSVIYAYYGPISILQPMFALPWIVFLILLGMTAWLWKRVPGIALGILWYIVALLPTLMNLFKGEGDLFLASDRYAYFAFVGILLSIGVIIESVLYAREESRTGAWVNAASIVGFIILALCSWRTTVQAQVWSSTEALFANVIKLYPGYSYIAHNNLGNMERLNGNLDAAIDQYNQSLAIHRTTKALSNLGAAYRKKGMAKEALDAYNEALKLDPRSPYAHFGLGLVYAAEGQRDLAEKEYQIAVDILPNYEEAYANLGALAEAAGNPAKAIEYYQKAVAINPVFNEGFYNLGIVLSEQGKKQEAVAAYEQAIAIDPTMIAARINVGLLYYEAGEVDRSAAQFKAVLKLNPQNKAARQALTQMGEL